MLSMRRGQAYGRGVSEIRVRLFAFCTLFVIGTDTFLTAPLLPLLQEHFHVDVGRSGWLVSAYALGYALLALISGPISDRLDRRTVLLIGVVAFTVFTAACGVTWDFWSLCVARFLAGVAAAFVTPQIWASIPVLVPRAAIVRTMGAATAGLAIAQVAGIPLGSFLSAAGWRLPFFAIAALGVLLWLLLYRVFPSVPPTHAPSSGLFAPYRVVMTSRPLLLSLVGYLVFQTGNFTALSFIGSWFARDYGASQMLIAGTMVLVGLGNATGSLVGPRLVTRLGRRPSLIVGVVALGCAYLGAGLASSLWAAALVLALAMVVAGFLFPVLMTQLQSHVDGARGTVSALSNSAMYIGVTVGGVVGGPLLAGSPGFVGVGLFAAATFVLALAAYALSGEFRRSPKADE
ncbi:MFS transporter [Rathayibacter iranicus]|nr:MFS transporter [Rathayibacter iranicus]PWJ66771.1 putative MFS family arabinose efflux permease [Rathayibacter iranicus NCPPB 2253 = VKM Ac-1602]